MPPEIIEDLIQKIHDGKVLAEFPMWDTLLGSDLVKSFTKNVLLDTVLRDNDIKIPEEKLIKVITQAHLSITTAIMLGYRLRELEENIKVN